MNGAVIDRVVSEYQEVLARLADWEAALAQLASGSYWEWKAGLDRLWRLVPFFEKEVPRHFQNEEKALFARVAARHADSDKALLHYSGEHTEFCRQWHNFRTELLYCDAVGETRHLCQSGAVLIAYLRRHMAEEERELLPLAA